MRPSLPRFSRSSASVYYTEHKLKNQNRGGLGTRLEYIIVTTILSFLLIFEEKIEFIAKPACNLAFLRERLCSLAWPNPMKVCGQYVVVSIWGIIAFPSCLFYLDIRNWTVRQLGVRLELITFYTQYTLSWLVQKWCSCCHAACTYSVVMCLSPMEHPIWDWIWWLYNTVEASFLGLSCFYLPYSVIAKPGPTQAWAWVSVSKKQFNIILS